MFPIWNWQFGWWIVVFLIFWRQRCQDHWLLLRLSSALKLLEWRSPSLIDHNNPRFCRLQWSSCSHLSWFLLLGLSQRDWRRLFMICCRPVFGWTWGIKKWNWLYYWYLFAGASPFFMKPSPVDDYAFGWLWFVRPFGPCFHLVFCKNFWAFITRCS